MAQYLTMNIKICLLYILPVSDNGLSFGSSTTTNVGNRGHQSKQSSHNSVKASNCHWLAPLLGGHGVNIKNAVGSFLVDFQRIKITTRNKFLGIIQNYAKLIRFSGS